MPMCNIMTGAGFDLGFMGGLSMAWIGMVVLFFLVIFSKKWIGEEMGIGFNVIAAFIGAYIPYIVVITITCQFKWALAVGIVGFIIGGFLIGQFIETGDGF